MRAIMHTKIDNGSAACLWGNQVSGLPKDRRPRDDPWSYHLTRNLASLKLGMGWEVSSESMAVGVWVGGRGEGKRQGGVRPNKTIT